MRLRQHIHTSTNIHCYVRSTSIQYDSERQKFQYHEPEPKNIFNLILICLLINHTDTVNEGNDKLYKLATKQISRKLILFIVKGL